MNKYFTTPRPVPVFITLCAVIIMGWLGVWQLQRLDWKEGLISKIETGRTLPPLTQLPADSTQWPALEFRRIMLHGHFPADADTFKVIASRDSVSGYTLVTPFIMKDGRTVLVNRGFVPSGMSTLPAATDHEITGLVRIPAHRPFFLPKDDVARNLWFMMNLPVMSQQAGIAGMPAYVEVTGRVEPGTYPAPSLGNIVLRNDHLGYAITWFSIALAAVVIFLVYHRKPKA